MPISKMLLQCRGEAAKSQLTFERTEAKSDKNGISRKGSQGRETGKDLKWNNILHQETRGIWKLSVYRARSIEKQLLPGASFKQAIKRDHRPQAGKEATEHTLDHWRGLSEDFRCTHCFTVLFA